MAVINGVASWGIVPTDNITSNLSTMSNGFRGNTLKSSNDQFRYQVQWFFAGNNEGVEASAQNAVVAGSHTVSGDVLNAIFKIETSVDDTNWDTIATIKKSRDITNKRFGNGSPPAGHRFTIDIGQLLSDQLSYSLCPINKGTWKSNYYGGLNGGLTMQDNVIGASAAAGFPISYYNVSQNGSFRMVRVSVTFDIITADNQITTASTVLGYADLVTAINSVNQFENDSTYYNERYNMSDSPTEKYRFLSRCPNLTDLPTITYDFKKPIRLDEQAEYLQFYLRKASSSSISSSGGDKVGAIGLHVETFLADGTAENDFYLRDFEDNLLIEPDSNIDFRMKETQNQMCIQNISPYYINNTSTLKAEQNPIDRDNFPYWNTYSGNRITASTAYYRVSMSRFSMYTDYAERTTTKFMYYTIDREIENIPYGFVRFHWLNSMGGIDSYTAKRDVVEGLTISRDVVERNSGDRTWYQDYRGSNNGSVYAPDNSLYVSDTMRGGDIYKGGREVSNVNADRVQSVYTEPLNKSVAKWLEEMMLSPNVWIEKDTEATEKANIANAYLNPSTKGYIPVIITNSDIESVNQENGLVIFNIEYTLAHKVETQRN